MSYCETCNRRIDTSEIEGDPYHRTDTGIVCDDCFNTKQDAKGKLKSHE